MSALYAGNPDIADSVSWLGASFAINPNSPDDVSCLDALYACGSKGVNVTIFCSIVIISCKCVLRLLVLKLQARFNSLYKSLTNTIYATTLANLCLSALGNISLFISQDHFDIAKSVNAALYAF